MALIWWLTTFILLFISYYSDTDDDLESNSDDDDLPLQTYLPKKSSVGRNQFDIEEIDDISVGLNHDLPQLTPVRKKGEVDKTKLALEKRNEISSDSDDNMALTSRIQKTGKNNIQVRSHVEVNQRGALPLPNRGQRNPGEENQMMRKHNECCSADIVKILKAQQKQINALSKGGRNVDNNNNYDDLFDQLLPLKTFPSYLQFQEKLKTDPDFQSSFVCTNISYIYFFYYNNFPRI